MDTPKFPMKLLPIFVVNCLALVAVGGVFPGPQDGWSYLAVALGLVSAHAVFAAFWMFYGLWISGKKELVGAIILGATILAFISYAMRTNAPKSVVIIAAAALMIQMLMALGALFTIRSFGWSVARSSIAGSHLVTRQFDLLQLFKWTTIVAMLLGIGRVLVPRLAALVDDDVTIYVIFFGLFVIGHALMMLPILWVCLAPRPYSPWTLVALLAIAGIAHIENVCFTQTTISVHFGTNSVFVTLISVSFFVTLTLALVSVRLLGFRFQRSEADISPTIP